MQGPIDDTGEEPFCPVPKGLAELAVSWLLSGAEEQLEFHVSICAGAISPTSVAHSDWMRCLRRTAVFA